MCQSRALPKGGQMSFKNVTFFLIFVITDKNLSRMKAEESDSQRNSNPEDKFSRLPYILLQFCCFLDTHLFLYLICSCGGDTLCVDAPASLYFSTHLFKTHTNTNNHSFLLLTRRTIDPVAISIRKCHNLEVRIAFGNLF